MQRIAIPELLQFICWQASQRSDLTTVRLVKFLYLADLYYARENGGETLTGWAWKFHNFGPWCGESFEAIKEAKRNHFIEGEERQSSYSESDNFTLFRCSHMKAGLDKKLDTLLPVRVDGALRKAIKAFASDTHGLLSYVYYETEPMIGATPGDILDFTKAVIPAELPCTTVVRKLSRSEIEKGRKILAGLSSPAPSKKVDASLYDEAYFKGVAWLDEQDREPLTATGVADLSDLFRKSK